MNEKKVYSYEWAGRPLVIEVGQLAKQANGAVLVRYGDTSVLSTATMSKSPKPLDFFPLTVNYEERLYAAGKIPGGFIKREGRPSEKAILASRLIDRQFVQCSQTVSVMKYKLFQWLCLTIRIARLKWLQWLVHH